MKRRIVSSLVIAAALLAAALVHAAEPQAVALPKPDVTGKVTLEQAIAQRRSVREYAPGALTLAEVSQLMWVAQGITGPDGKRATPSARAVYPLQVWLVANDVTGLPAGIYRYEPKEHALAPVSAGDQRDSLLRHLHLFCHLFNLGMKPEIMVRAMASRAARSRSGRCTCSGSARICQIVRVGFKEP